MEYKSQYWAALPADEILAELTCKIDDYYKYLRTNNRLSTWKIAYQTYNQAMYKGTRVRKVGRHGEYQNMTVNHYRNLIQHLITMTINQRPSFEPRATNTDVESQAQTVLARGLLDYYMREKRLERYLKQAVEFAMLYGEGFITTTWNATTGDSLGIDPETEIEIKQGDIEYRVHEPIDVVRAVSVNSAQDCQWYIIRSYVNKFDLAAKYPELQSEILASQCKFNPLQQFKNDIADVWAEELVEVWEMFHDRTDALPDGRYVYFIDGNVVMLDGPLPYRNNVVYRVAPSELSGTPFGYTPANDLLPIQEMTDILYSTIITNQSAFGVQNIMAPKGSNVNVTELRDGMNFIEYDAVAGPPQAMNLTATSPEIFNMLNILERTLETISGVNSVARGNPESSLKSGAALALVQSMAVQFSQGLQHSYVQLLEDVGTATINILKDYAAVPRVAMIAGKGNRGLMRQFSGADLQSISRVQVDAGNPMTRTTAGKVELATLMLSNGLIKYPDELLQVIQTGNLDAMVEGRTTELIAIKAENEALAEGKQVPVMITDDHLLHIQEHKAIVSDPTVREDAGVVTSVTEHIMLHYQFLSDPTIAPLLALMGQQPVAAVQPTAVGPGAMPTQPQQTTNDLAAANQPNMPNMPVSPLEQK